MRTRQSVAVNPPQQATAIREAAVAALLQIQLSSPTRLKHLPFVKAMGHDKRLNLWMVKPSGDSSVDQITGIMFAVRYLQYLSNGCGDFLCDIVTAQAGGDVEAEENIRTAFWYCFVQLGVSKPFNYRFVCSAGAEIIREKATILHMCRTAKTPKQIQKAFIEKRWIV